MFCSFVNNKKAQKLTANKITSLADVTFYFIYLNW